MPRTKSEPECQPAFECPFFISELNNKEEVLKACKALEDRIVQFENQWEVTIDWSGFVIADILRAFSRDVQKLTQVDDIAPSQFKLAGLIAFWIRKLKPLLRVAKFKKHSDNEFKGTFELYLNETFALFIGLAVIMLDENLIGVEEFRAVALAGSFIHLLSHLRYRAISPQAMTTIFELMIKSRWHI